MKRYIIAAIIAAGIACFAQDVQPESTTNDAPWELNEPRMLLDVSNAPPVIQGAFSNYVEAIPTYFMFANNVLSLNSSNETLWVSNEAHDWGSWMPTGSSNPDRGVVTLNKPLVILPTNVYYKVVNGFAVLACDNASAQNMATGGSVTWTFSDGSGIRWKAEADALVGANAAGISVSNDTIRIQYALDSAGPTLAISRADTLGGDWYDCTNAVFTQISTTIREAAIPVEGQLSGFFRAYVAAAAPAHVEYDNPQHFLGGIMVAEDDFSPVIYDTTLIITNNGTAYRIPAQTLPQTMSAPEE